MEFVPVERLPFARAYLADRFMGRRASELYDAIFTGADGKPVDVQLRSQVVRLKDADPFIVYIVRDVTVQHEAQRQLIETERWASMGRLASFVAHEINTPLTNISLLTASISRRVRDPEVQERLNKIAAQGRIAATITAELLKFARPGAINAVEADLTDIVRAAVEQTEVFRKPGVELRSELGSHPVICNLDPLRIQEVFVNLLKNAYEATPRGHVRIRLEDLESLVAVSVSDTGAGIPPEAQQRLFEAFFTTKKKGEGTGLGLAISRNFVASHGGDITVASEPGKGSTFTVVLPKQAQRVRAAE
jgi:signal transduction histidine kinase